ncbi:type IV secretory system conjugative DNA transfer family protein [Agrococcus sp. Ld7]|uniref:type IV secretory system conjugative DNA transfer family protein n=1 Tax=Agrococcus sp. Ld7 TaxID=649148 RepID=UPI0038664C25
MSDELFFARLLPGLNQSSQQVQRLLEILSSGDAPRPLIFETWATDEGVQHFVGRTASSRSGVRSLVRSHLPGSQLVRQARPSAPELVARLRQRNPGLPLSSSSIDVTLFALHGVLAQRRKGETIAIQVVIGTGLNPERVATKIVDPGRNGLIAWLSGEVQAASAETRHRLADWAAQPRLAVTIRIGVTAAVRERSMQIRHQLLAAFRQLNAPDTRLELATEPVRRWQRASANGAGGLVLSAAQLVPFLGWPIDELELPGLPPLHPRQLPPPAGVTDDGAVLAIATAPGREKPIGLEPEARLQHLVVTGGTGSGKSQLLAALALDDIKEGRPLILIEPKRQLVDTIVARAPKKAAGRIVIIDAADPVPVGFNPLDLGERDPGPVVDGILEVFKAVFKEGWGPRTEDLLHAGLLTLVADGQRRGRPHTLLDLPPLLADDGYRRSVVGAVASDPTLAAYWAAYNGLSPAHRANIAAAPLNKLRKYVLRRNVAAVLGQSRPRFRLRDVFKDGNRAVLVPLNDALIGPGAAQLLGGLIVAEAWLATQERAVESEPMKRPAMVFIDEVQRYAHLPTSIEDALATSRSYGVAWHVALQGRSQVSTNLALALELNARNQISFAASPNDARALARTTSQLSAEDFQSLGRFAIYANLVVDGAPAGWFAARTLPPVAEAGNADLIRRRNQEAFAGDAAPTPTAPDSPKPSTPAPADSDAAPGLRPNQKRRRV